MTTKEKAQELVDKFKDYVHGYIGSSMLTNYEYPEQILSQAKKVATITVDEILDVLGSAGVYSFASPDVTVYWEEVKKEIEKL